VPPGLADELPGLYGSLFSTLDWFLACDRTPPGGACVLDEPRHVILFRRDGRVVQVLNKAFPCEPADAERICRALFRALPGVHRLHLDVMFDPDALGYPKRVRDRIDRMVIDLPATVDDYYRSLGKKTRKNIRWGQNHLARAIPELTTETVSPGDRSEELVQRLVQWKIERYRRKGLITYWEVDPSLLERTAALMRRCGKVRITSVAGREVALDLVVRVGDSAYAYESANDPSYDEFSLGFLSFYRLICDAIESGARRLDALDGTEWSKTPLGAHPVRTTRLSVYPDRLRRLLSLGEALLLLRERLRRQRHAVGQRLRRSRRGKVLADVVTRLRRRRLDSPDASESGGEPPAARA
jgi:CelD/BcsL family acetyltransferase involved in cellulose biosynthesis